MRLEYAQTLDVGIAHPTATAILYLIVPCYLINLGVKNLNIVERPSADKSSS